MSYTPGPWSCEAGDSRIKILSGNRVIASVSDAPYWKKFTPEDADNARLIAAAPDLLEVCEKLMEQLINLAPSAHPQEISAFDEGADAIAKATGKD